MKISNFFRKILYFIGLTIIILIFIRLINYNSLFDFDGHFFYKKYYILAISIFIIAFTSNYINQKIFENSFLIIFSFLVSLYTIELFLNFLEIYKRGEDKSSIVKVFKNEIKKNTNVSINIPPTSYMFKDYNYLPLSNKKNTLIIDCNELGYYSMNFSDKFGFNNNNANWENQIDYFFVGDSFGYGFCVNRENNIPSLVSKIRKKNIVNLSMAGSGLLVYFAILKENKIKINNSKIILLINDHDFVNTYHELKDRILIKYLMDENYTQDLINININSIHDDLFKKRYSKLPFQSFLLLKKLRFLINYMTATSMDKFQIDIETKKKIDLIFRSISKQFENSDIIIIRHPLKDQFVLKNYNFQYRALLEEIIKEYEFKYINTDEIFYEEKNPLSLFSKDYGHLNEMGFKKISKYISKNL